MVPRDLRNGSAGPQATGLKGEGCSGFLPKRPRYLPLETDRASASVQHRYVEIHATRPMKPIVGGMSAEEREPLHFDLERGCTVRRRHVESGALQFPKRGGITRLETQLQKPTAVRGLFSVQHTEGRLSVSCCGFHMNTWPDVGPSPGTPECEPLLRNARSVGASCEALSACKRWETVE